MVVAKTGNYTPVEDEFDFWVARIECLCSVYFQHYYLMLPRCHLGVFNSQTAHRLEPYWLPSAEIRSSTLYGTKKTVEHNISIQVVISNAGDIVENIEGSSDLRWNKGLLYPSTLSWTSVSLHL